MKKVHSSLRIRTLIAASAACATLVGCQSSPIERDARAPASAVDRAKDAMEELLFGNVEGLHTDAFLVMKNGKTLYERYARGYGEKSKHLSWSMGKSIAALVAAHAIDEGKFGLEDAVSRWVPEYQGPAKIIDLFTMSSGITFREEYSGVPVDSDATKMLYLEGPKVGFAAYTAKLPKRRDVKPGDHFYYSSGDANLIMDAMKTGIADEKRYDDYPWTALFDRLDIEDATFEQDSRGVFVGSSYIYLTAREFARVGQLIADKGVRNGETLIPGWYFDRLTKVAPGVMKKALPGTSATRAYSMQTTTNRPITGRGLASEYPSLPADAILMIGHQGQLVIASPGENFVIVRLATDKGDPFNPYRQSLFYAVRNFLSANGVVYRGAGDKKEGEPTLPPPVTATPQPKGKTNYADYLKVPKLMRALYAKELCSCIFVLERTEDECHDDLKQSLPLLPFAKIDRKAKTVKTTLTKLRSSKAVYRGDRLGCTLLD